MSKDFQVIDLISQRYALNKVFQGMSKAKIVDWLSQKGKVTLISKMHPESPDIYFFESIVGVSAGFIAYDNEIVLLGDHTVIT